MSSNRPAIAAEIQAALTQHGTLTSSELVDCCPSADDREIVSKVIYQMRQSGVIEKAGTVPGTPGRGSKQVSQWRLVDAHQKIDTEVVMPRVHMKFPATSRFDAPGEDYQPATEPPLGGMTHAQYEAVNAAEPADTHAIDPTEEALSDLVDQADEAVLALADSLLSDHPVWNRLRALQADAFQTLCDWRLRSYLSTQDKDSNQ